MSTIEDRLTSALAARAEQVQPEDLREEGLPAPKVTWLRHPATYVVAAAACAAAIAAPFVLDLGDADPSPAPPFTSQTPTPSETLPPQEDVGGDWPVEFGTSPVDVDGDGVKDRTRVRHEPGEPLAGPRARVEVDLSSTGATVFGIVETFDSFVNVAEAVDLDGDGDRELTIYRDDTDYRNGAEPFAVLSLVEDRLVEATVPATPALVTGIIHDGDTGRGYQSRVWVTAGVMRSYITTDTYTGVEPLNLPLTYPVQVTSWSMVDGALVPRDQGRQCIDIAADPGNDLPVPCPAGFGDTGSPALFPEQDQTIGLGESFEVAKGSVTFTVSLDGGPVDHGAVEPGTTELVVELPGGEVQRVPLPGGWVPAAYTTPVRMAGSDLTVLVAQEGGDSTTMTLVVVRQGKVMAALTDGPVPFGGGWLGAEAQGFQTWIGPDNVVYTRVMTEPMVEQYDVYRWALGGTVSIDETPTLQPQSVGCFDIDNSAPGGAVTPCA